MWSKLFGRKNLTEHDDADKAAAYIQHSSVVRVDMHSHLIPGIDDGAQSIEESIRLISMMKDMGYDKIITTPHIRADHYPNTPQIIKSGLEFLLEEVGKRNIDIVLDAAAEYFVDDTFTSLLDSNEQMLTINGKELLIEFSFVFEPTNVEDILFKIQTSGYKPILAHPERYAYYHDNLKIFESFTDRGCYLQLNALSLSGYYGKSVKSAAEKLLDKGLYHYCGSDAHHVRHTETLKKMMAGSSIHKMLSGYTFANDKLLS